MGRESQVHNLTPDFTVVALKMWAYGPKNRKNSNLWYKFFPKGYIPLSNFYKILPGGWSPRTAPSYQISPWWHKKCGLTAPKIVKKW